MFLKCSSYMRWMPEPKLGLALCSLYKGKPRQALSWLEEPIDCILSVYGAADPDPVEWAYYIVSLLCSGKLDAATTCATDYASLRHPELDRARWVTRLLNGHAPAFPSTGDDCKRRRSIHVLPTRTGEDWIANLCTMLVACGQVQMAQELRREQPLNYSSPSSPEANPSKPAQDAIRKPTNARSRSLLRRRIALRPFYIRARERVAALLHSVERKHGYFLPYHLSESRNDELFTAIRDLAADARSRAVLMIGARRGQAATEAFLAGIRENQNRPGAVCVDRSRQNSVQPSGSAMHSPRYCGYVQKITGTTATGESQTVSQHMVVRHLISC